MKRRGTVERPDIPAWVADFREWDGMPDAPLPVRYGRWGDEQWVWLDRYGYDVFDLNDAVVRWKRGES